MPGVLYIVATPIGNLEDMTLRAIRVLKEVQLVCAEDTRHTRRLLEHFGIHSRLTSYFEHNEREKTPEIIARIKAGDSVAVVTDAGTPGISDPGYRLVKAAVSEGVRVVPVPGPSAIITALSAAGLPTDEFTFKGFVPSGGAALKKFLLELKTPDHTFIVYDSPRRVASTLESIVEILGDIEVALARELTKVHEEVLRGSASEVRRIIGDAGLKGEVTLVIRTGGEKKGEGSFSDELKRLLDSGIALKDAVKAVAAEFGLPRGEVYREGLRLTGKKT